LPKVIFYVTKFRNANNSTNMNFFNNSTTSGKKAVPVNSSVIDVTSTQSTSNPDLNNNLSWAESIGSFGGNRIVIDEEDVVFDSDSVPQVRDLLDPNSNSERTIASMFVNSQQDSPMVLLLRALEQYPRREEIDKQRKILEENIAKLQKAKVVLSAVTTISQGVNPDAVKAYSSTDAALNEATNSRDRFEAELRDRGQSIKQLLANCQTGTDSFNIQASRAIADIYGFTDVN
jgi:hypothetical protein